jgi:hypothetical protein
MGSHSDCFCWEIIQCDKSNNCPAKNTPEKPCWEIAREIDGDYRNFFNICRDCLVHVLKAENSVLSYQEAKSIVEAKQTASRLATKKECLPCQRISSLPTVTSD